MFSRVFLSVPWYLKATRSRETATFGKFAGSLSYVESALFESSSSMVSKKANARFAAGTACLIERIADWSGSRAAVNLSPPDRKTPIVPADVTMSPLVVCRRMNAPIEIIREVSTM